MSCDLKGNEEKEGTEAESKVISGLEPKRQDRLGMARLIAVRMNEQPLLQYP